VRKWRRLGTAGSILLATGGWGAGALPAFDSLGWWRDRGPGVAMAGGVLAYLGMVLLVFAWWRLGRVVSQDPGIGAGRMARVLLCWAAPLALAPPLFSTDVYSYVAQGVMAARGLDVYHSGPAVLGDPLVANIPDIWRNTPAPYGPAFIGMAATVVRVTGENVVPAVLGMRAVTLLAFGAIAWGVRSLARATGVSQAGALWAAVVNPLVLVHVVAGVHNDAIMMAFMMVGFVLARRGHLLSAVAAETVAMMVKAPAGVALLFLVPLSPWGRGRLWPGLRRALAAAGVVTVVTAALTVAVGQGFGWIGALRTPTAAASYWSVSTDVGRLLRWLASLRVAANGATGVPLPMVQVAQCVFLVAALAAIMYWVRRSSSAGPVYAAGMALLALVALSPVVQPWYLLWGAVPLAAVAWQHMTAVWPKVLVSALIFSLLPSGAAPTTDMVLSAAIGVLLALVVLYALPAAELGSDRVLGAGGIRLSAEREG
jgi:hypothetical protein